MEGEWVNFFKTHEVGEIIRAKRRVVTFGYQQKKDIDYFETFAATPNAASIRLLLATVLKE